MTVYSDRLGAIEPHQFQTALDRFGLGTFLAAEPIPFGLFGQNVRLTSTTGRYVLRGAALHTWQFQKERFVARVLHEQTGVPVPWPYHFDADESLFGWPHGYAVMPCMPGLSLADEALLRTLPGADRQRIAGLLGVTLRDVQRATWDHSGQYDVDVDTIVPFPDGFAGWLVGELRHLVTVCIGYGAGATDSDGVWVEEIIAAASKHLDEPAPPVLVLHDYKEGNVTVERCGADWRVGGVFDLVEALFGDGEMDLIRQLALFLEEPDAGLAEAFLAGYRSRRPLRAGAAERLTLYLVYERMLIWEYFHQPDTVHRWWYAERTPREWLTPYVQKLRHLLR